MWLASCAKEHWSPHWQVPLEKYRQMGPLYPRGGPVGWCVCGGGLPVRVGEGEGVRGNVG